MHEQQEKFITYLRSVKNASEHTLRNYNLDLSLFGAFMEKESLILSKVDKRVVRAYLAHLALKNASKRTLARRLSSLRSFFQFLTREKKIVHNPMDEIESPKLDKRLPATLNYEQIERLFAQPDTSCYLGFRDRTAMELFYSSGLRVSELVGLNREDFDYPNLKLKVRGKGKKERVVPITKSAATWIHNYLGHAEREEKDARAIFINKLGTRLTVRSIDRKFKEYLKMSGLSGRITPHTIRHAIATHWLEKGMDLKTIQVLLGHSSLATTTIYTQVSSKLKREVYEKTHPLAIQD